MQDPSPTGFTHVFKRYEKKYLLTPAKRAALLERLQGHITADHFGLSTVGSLYLDTDDFHLIRQSISKPKYKEKLRVRCYGNATPDSVAFLELKKKFKGVVYKRRISLPLSSAMLYLEVGVPPLEQTQIFREIDFAIRRYHPVPKVLIAYDRVAFFGNEDRALRITMDHNLRFRQDRLDLTLGSEGTPVIDPQLVVMEIKIPGAMPLWLAHILTELSIFPGAFTKYGNCYKNFICPSQRREMYGVQLPRQEQNPLLGLAASFSA